VLVIAGSSAGRSDHTAAVLTRVGGLAVRGIAVRPGRPALLGYARPGRIRADQPVPTVPVIGIPDYPLAAAVIFELFAVPLLAALQGMRAPDRAWQRIQLACDWTSSPDVEDWVPVSLPPAGTPAGGRPACQLRRRSHAGQARRRIHQPTHARQCVVADSHRAGTVRARHAH
jgi:putative molybdopterin biosynthesis protein